MAESVVLFRISCRGTIHFVEQKSRRVESVAPLQGPARDLRQALFVLDVTASGEIDRPLKKVFRFCPRRRPIHWGCVRRSRGETVARFTRSAKIDIPRSIFGRDCPRD